MMTGQPPLKVLHIISGLHMGGAEMALYRLVSTLDPGLFQHFILSLTHDQPVGDLIRSLGIPVEPLGFHSGFPDPCIIFRLKQKITDFNPDIIQTWMYHADLLGALAAKLAGNYPVVWNIRHAISDKGSLKTSTYIIARINALLSHHLPARIVCNAKAGMQTHVAMGFDADKMLVIENGFDPSRFFPDKDSKAKVCDELGLPKKVFLVGMAARYNPQKDHPNFLRAAALLLKNREDVYFLLWGNNVGSDNVELAGLIQSLDVQKRVLMLGLRMDTQRLYTALDIATLSSAYEAFPQVIGEAMSCGVPCVVTDVGDSSRIVGKTGRVVPPHNPQALANAWDEMLSMPVMERRGLGEAARERIETMFSLEAATQKYSLLYQSLLKKDLPS